MYTKKIIATVALPLFLLLIYIWNHYEEKKLMGLQFAGERIFLEYHKNDFAINLLEIAKSRLELNISPEIQKEKFFKIYFLLGRIYFVENNLPKSISNYTASIELNPNYKENYYGRGLTYGYIGGLFLDNAEADFLKYIELDNLEFKKTGKHAYGSWAGYNDLAWIYFMKGNFKKSEEYSELGLVIAPNSAWLLNTLGVSLLAQKKCDDALKYLKLSKTISENISVSQFGEAYTGDNPSIWELGKDKMVKTIEENIKLCEVK